MSTITSYATQQSALLDMISPASRAAAGDVNGSAIDASRFKRIVANLLCGAIAAGATAQVVFQDSADGSTGWADISGAATVAHTDTDDDKAAQLELRLDQNPTIKRYVRAVYRQTGAFAVLGAVLVRGSVAIHEPASNFNKSGLLKSTVVV